MSFQGLFVVLKINSELQTAAGRDQVELSSAGFESAVVFENWSLGWCLS